ncbi:unnamed protein product [Linum trigynum]|uniref:Uncharacterized protein n=1 Tax=Linum trigynum TaxID=586398 RepID=A0AAV2E6A1_9ROSI
MGQFAEPCYTPRPDSNYELRLLVEQFARDIERRNRKMNLFFPSFAPPNSSSLRESEETVPHSSKQTERIQQVCAQLAQDHPSATILEEEEEDEGYKDIVEQTEVVTESSREDHDQECSVVADHTFLHPTPIFEEVGLSKEMQDDLMKEIAWQLDLQSVVEEEERERMRKEVGEDDGSELEEVLDLFRMEELNYEEGRGVEEAIGVQDGDEVEVEEACTGLMLQVISPPNFKELLSKNPFAVSLCQTKATSTSVPLGGRDGGQSMLSYLVWGNETREEKKRSRGWRLHLHQMHELPSPVISHVRDLRLHLIYRPRIAETICCKGMLLLEQIFSSCTTLSKTWKG